eukprot:TRINITY_DN988_c0_g1_i1.p1 TRINITY_DN988_c0_g1~~TRINITY_DN988_c0_g1_i1.p1  ORF type:complete len:274 (+),score=32.64 TRINITY_DN988_c0_g1_i1:234-1055(+)
MKNLSLDSSKESPKPSEDDFRSCATRRAWSEKDDEALVQAIAQNGMCWMAVATAMRSEGREEKTSKQCRERWMQHLKPKISRSCFSQEEQEKLFLMQNQMGNRWVDIAKMLPGRTDNDIKNLYYSKVRAEIRRLRKELKKLGNRSIFTRSKYFKLLKRAQVNVLEFSQFSTERVMELFRVLPNSKRKNFGERLKSDPTLPCLKKTNYVDTPAQSNLKERIEGYEKIDQKVVYFILKLFIESIFRRAEVASYLSLARIKQGMCFRAPAFSVAKS